MDNDDDRMRDSDSDPGADCNICTDCDSHPNADPDHSDAHEHS